jgi:hypothetical protein
MLDKIEFPVLLTHRGFFGFCPVYFAQVESEAPMIVERHPWLAPLNWLSGEVQRIWIWLRCFFDRDYEPEWALIVMGELEDAKWLNDDGSISH